jgi:tetratricopeptide (TPR) repeat protein
VSKLQCPVSINNFFLPHGEWSHVANCCSHLEVLALYDEQTCLTFADPHSLLPLSRNKRFVGRESELERLEHDLYSEDACQRVAIVGLGGVGKTQIALELAYRMREDTPDLSIFWVPATQPAAFEQAYQRICECLQIPRVTEDIADVKKLVKESLSKDNIGPWLLIVDNADDSKMLFERDAEDSTALALIDYLPFSRNGSIIFTTRNRKVAVKLAGTNVIQVSLMKPDDAKEVLRGCLLDKDLLLDTEAAAKLLDLLGYLPLAIVQAAAYMNENDISITDYTDLYNGSEKEIIDILSEDFEDQGRYRDIQNSIAKTWLISFNQIQRQTPLAIEYLSFMACLLNQDIPQSILPQASTKKNFLEAVGILTAYSLLIRREDRKTFDIHGLVHLAIRNWLRNMGQMTMWANKTVERLAEIIPAGGHQDRDIWTAYLPHASHLLKSEDLKPREEKFITLSDHLGRCLYSNGRYVEAEQVHRQTLDLRINALGANDPDTLMSSACLAEALSHQGKYAEAEKLHRETLEIRKKVLGVEHPDVMNSMQYLAQALVGAGAYSEAEKIHRATRDLRAKLLHPEHRSTLTSMSYLAEALNQQGKYEEAEQMHQQTLEIRIRLFGLSFPATLASMSCLGVTQRNLKKYDAAESTQREVLRLRLNVLGDRHPHTLITKRWLADVLHNQAKYKEAAEILQEILDIQAQLLGEKHPDTMHTLSNLAETTYSQGRLTQAKGLYEEVYNLREEALGPTHPDTLESMSNLATFIFRQGDVTKAKDMHERVLEMRMKRLGHEHPHTLESIAFIEGLRHEKGDDNDVVDQ